MIPDNAPQPRGLGFIVHAFVDADHASDTMTRRSRTGFLVHVNSSLIYWNSKKQNSVESSTFGSEFTAMKQCTKCLRGLRCKLRMMGIPVNGPAFIKGDNQSVLCDRTMPKSIKGHRALLITLQEKMLSGINGEQPMLTHI